MTHTLADADDLVKENIDLKKQLSFVLERMASFETRFNSLESSLRLEISDLRKENADLKAYVQSKLDQNNATSKKAKEGASLTRKTVGGRIDDSTTSTIMSKSSKRTTA